MEGEQVSKFRIFKEQPLNSNYLNPKKEAIKNFFQQKSEEELFEIKDDYVNQLMEEYKIVYPQLDYENIHYEVKEEGNYDIYVFKIPFNGKNIEYFKLEPSEGLMWSHDVYINSQDLCFDIYDSEMSVGGMIRKYQGIVKKIKERSSNVNKFIELLNEDLKRFIESEFNKRSNRIINRKKKIDALDLPKD